MFDRVVLINALSASSGGGFRYISSMLAELDRDPRGLRCEVALPTGLELPIDGGNLRARRYSIRRFPWVPASAVRLFHEQVSLPLRARGASLIFCPSDFAPLIPLSVPLVLGIQNLNVIDDRFYRTPRLRALRSLLPIATARATRIVVPSHATREELHRILHVPLEKIEVVHHGVSPRLSGRDTEFSFNHDQPEAGYLLLPAALERHKNIETAIRAMALLEGPKRDLWIAGSDQTDPRYADDLHRLVAELGLAEHIHFLGLVPTSDMDRLYRGASAVVFPSLLETFGFPLLESMATGTPAIVSDIPVFREIAADGALFFPPRDPAGLATAIHRLSADPALGDQLVRRGLDRSSEFTWKRSMDELCRIFHDVLGGTPAEDSRPRPSG